MRAGRLNGGIIAWKTNLLGFPYGDGKYGADNREALVYVFPIFLFEQIGYEQKHA